MEIPVRSLVPMAFVKNVPASIDFYHLLGFEVGNTFAAPGSEEPTWAYLSSGKAPETYEEWNRETGGAKLPERVKPVKKRKASAKRATPKRRKSARKAK